MPNVKSEDGTEIAYERQGSGPAVILVGGGLDDGSENGPLATELARYFTVLNFARRGRDGSGNTPPYAVARELEDIGALIAEAGGSAILVGVSSGGMFALEAAAAGLPIAGLVVYDVPYDTTEDAAERYDAYRRELGTILADGRRGDAVALFMRLAGSSEEDVEGARRSPYWPGLEALAHTLAYDAALYGPPPLERLSTITQPTMVITGSSENFYAPAADVIAASIPNAERVVFEGQGHVADPKALAAVLKRYLQA